MEELCVRASLTVKRFSNHLLLLSLLFLSVVVFKENNIGWVSNRDQLIFKKIPSVVLLLFIRSFIQQKSQRTGKSALKSETMGIYYMNPTREHPINKSVIKVFIPPRVQRNLRLGVYFSYTLQLL